MCDVAGTVEGVAIVARKDSRLVVRTNGPSKDRTPDTITAVSDDLLIGWAAMAV